jgi:hypothetical protein
MAAAAALLEGEAVAAAIQRDLALPAAVVVSADRRADRAA